MEIYIWIKFVKKEKDVLVPRKCRSLLNTMKEPMIIVNQPKKEFVEYQRYAIEISDVMSGVADAAASVVGAEEGAGKGAGGFAIW